MQDYLQDGLAHTTPILRCGARFSVVGDGKQ